MLKYGAHMSIAKGFLAAAKKTHEVYGAKTMQVFLKSPRGRMEKPLSDEDAKAFKDYITEHNIFVVGHCSYLLNFAKKIDYSDPWTLKSLISDLKKMHRMGGIGIVLHIGKYLDLPHEEALTYLKENIAYVIEQTEEENNDIILEITAGQGTEIGHRMDELENIYKNYLGSHPRIKFCFDTAHAFAAGYDLNTKESVREVFQEFDTRLGLKNLDVIHFNNSKKALGSRVDRHHNLELGLIAVEGLQEIAKIAEENNIPLVLETPEKDGMTHAKDIEILKGWMNLG